MRVRLVHRQHHVTADGDVLVCDTDRAVVHTVRGVHAASMRQVIDHAAPDLDLPDDAVTLDLVTAGLLARCAPDTDHDGGPLEARPAAHATDAPHTSTAVDRRRFLGLSATAAAGITTLALPTAAHAASHELPAAPTGDEYIGTNTSSRQFIVYWEPVPAPFDYSWSAFNTSSGKTLLASGTASASYFETVVYTWPIGSTSLRLEITSITDPAVSDALDYSA